MPYLLRQNLFANPNSEAGIFSSGGGGTGTKTQDSTQKHSGTYSTKYVWGSTNPWGFQSTGSGTPTAATAGQTYMLSAWVYCESGAFPQTFQAAGTGYANGATLSNGTVANTYGVWQRVYGTYVAPNSGMLFYGLAAAASTYYVDDIMMTVGNTLGNYFDGNTAATAFKTYSWTGAANASVSNEYSVLDAAADSFSLNDIEYRYWKAVSGLSSGSLADCKLKGLQTLTGLSGMSIEDMALSYWRSQAGLPQASLWEARRKVTQNNDRAYFASFFK